MCVRIILYEILPTYVYLLTQTRKTNKQMGHITKLVRLKTDKKGEIEQDGKQTVSAFRTGIIIPVSAIAVSIYNTGTIQVLVETKKRINKYMDSVRMSFYMLF